jgi:putative addiction module killer protein
VRGRIATRLNRLANGNAGDAKSVGGGIWEMRIDYGPGYRIYYKQMGQQLVFLLCAGDKTTQNKDIEQAKQLAKELEENENG